jgi:phage portal protein BeeE
MRAAGYRARPPALASSRPPLGALANPSFNGLPHQPLWPAYEGPQAVRVGNRNVYAARCIERIANDISGLPFYAGNMKSRTPRPTTAMQQLLGPAPGSPNPQWSAAKLWNYTARQWLILGKYAWLHEYNDAGKIVALWPLMAQYVVPVVAPIGAPGYFDLFRYGVQGSPGYREFKPADITYVWNPSDEDVRLPRAPLSLANWGIKISQLLDAYDDAFLSNGGVPAYLVTTPSFADQKSRRSFRDQFRRRFGGPSNANKALFAETDVEPGEVGTVPSSTQSVSVQVIGTSQKDAQLDVLRNNRIADMCVAFGVPLSILGNSADAKFTNMATDRTNYWRDTVGGHIRTLADGLNTAFGPLVDGPQDIGWFDTSNVPEMRRPPVFDAHEGLAAVAAGTITLNEYRADRGLDKLTDPDADVAKPRPTAVLRLSDVLGNGADPAAALAAADKAAGGTDNAGTEPPTKTPGKAAPPPAPSPKRADAVRTDLLGVVRGQLAVELADQAAELRARIEGKRGGRKRAHAGLDLGLAYEADHWRERMARNLGPALAAAGVREPDGWSEDITSAVFESISGLTPDDPWQASFGVDEVLGRLRPLAPATLLLDGA